MSRRMSLCIAMAVVASLLTGTADARRINHQKPTPVIPTGSHISLDQRHAPPLRSGAAAPDTTVLGAWTFDSGGCDAEGWTSYDRSAQLDTYFHVDDFSGLSGGDFGRLVALEGTQSLWCGARPSVADPYCGYATLPGYGNSWLQVFETSECFAVSGDASVDFLIAWDTEAGYDWVALDLVECPAPYIWSYERIAGGADVWDDVFSGFQSVTIHDSLYTDSLRVRFRFESDRVWSDEDGLYDSDGAVILDSLTVRDAAGIVLPTEAFEAETVGATTTVSGNWTAAPGPTAGDFAALYPGMSVLQEDPCVSNLTCFWSFFTGSTHNYSCGGHPEQTAVTRPIQSAFGDLYIDNEIWSPWIPLTGSGAGIEIAFDVYRDLPLEASIFYLWHVRFSDGGCPTRWIESEFPYFGDYKDWFRFTADVGYLVPPGATSMQVALSATDWCRYWYCFFGEYCRSHAPLFDNVEVRRIDSNGPAWSVRDIDLFQDNFAADGTTTGTVRADAAIDLLPFANIDIRPGDSVVVHVGNPEGTLATDIYTGMGPAVYTYVSVRPPGQPGKDGPALTGDPTRWPLVDSLTYAGHTWYCLRMDSALTAGEDPDTAFCIDLNDNLFTPGDTIFYVFGAIGQTPAVEATYYSRFTGTTDDMAHALSNPMEFTCLPTQNAQLYYPTAQGVWIAPSLYVDFYDGYGAQPYFEAAFDELGITASIDRYDVLSPSAFDGNSPSGRVVDVAGQLIPAYQRIIWSTGDLRDGILGGDTYKYDAAAMLEEYLDLVPSGGVFFTGDDIAERWSELGGSAATLRGTYINHSVLSGDHMSTYGVSPVITGLDGGIFDHGNEDTWVAYGGCPTLSDFDVLVEEGTATFEASYGVSAAAAVIAQETVNPVPAPARVVLSGFSFHEIQSVMNQNQPATPAHVLWDILMYLEPGVLTGIDDTSPRVNSLAQNVPNPFNPTTTIEFTVRERAPVSLRVYNVRGQLVRTLVDDTRAPGITHRIQWDGHNNAGQGVASGVYFYRLITKGYTKTRKMVLLK